MKRYLKKGGQRNDTSNCKTKTIPQRDPKGTD